MKFTCSKYNLLNALQIVSKAVPNRTTMSILECILIEVQDNTIRLTANDTDLGIETVIEGNVFQRGVIALDAKIFLEIIRKLPDSNITLESDENFKTTITCEKAKFNIIGKSGEEFTRLPDIEKKNPLVISQFTLKEAVRQTIFSISDNDSNKIMTGELFEIKDNILKVVSLDGHRISIRYIELRNEYPDISVIVPGKTLNEISKIISGDTGKDIFIYFSDKQIIFEFDNTLVVSRLIDGEYFRIDQMLSNDYESKIRINKKEFLSCIDRATLLIKEGDKKPVIINIMNDLMSLKINSTVGSMNEEIDITKQGKDIMIGFNPKFLIDALRVIDDEEIDIYLVNAKAPCIIKDDEGKYIYLILPVNFNNVD